MLYKGTGILLTSWVVDKLSPRFSEVLKCLQRAMSDNPLCLFYVHTYLS